MIHEWKIAKARRNQQQQRTKLLDLANELAAGSVKHRLDARAKTLNALRLAAVEELRAEAALAGQAKELPGPNASEWLHWACSLQDAENASVLRTLSSDFPAVERFTSAIEERNWIPGQGVNESPRQPSKPSAQSAEKPIEMPARLSNLLLALRRLFLASIAH